jgi:O-antigen ligase
VLLASVAGRAMAKPKRRTLVVLGIALILFSTVAVVVGKGTRLLSIASTGRFDRWTQAVDVAWHHPLGVGLGNLYRHVEVTGSAVNQGIRQYPHNILLEAAAEGGWIALVALLYVLFVSGRLLWRDASDGVGRAAIALFAFAISNAMLSSDLVGNRLVWVSIGMALALALRNATVPPARSTT